MPVNWIKDSFCHICHLQFIDTVPVSEECVHLYNTTRWYFPSCLWIFHLFQCQTGSHNFILSNIPIWKNIPFLFPLSTIFIILEAIPLEKWWKAWHIHYITLHTTTTTTTYGRHRQRLKLSERQRQWQLFLSLLAGTTCCWKSPSLSLCFLSDTANFCCLFPIGKVALSW